MSKKKLVIATGNDHKVKEIQAIIGRVPLELVQGSTYHPGEIIEDGDSYEANALIKARAYSRLSGLPALADDSGLEVDALGGLPGIRSNRLFGEHLSDPEKVKHLLKRLDGVAEEDRTARFVSHAVIVYGENILVSCCGTVEGRIIYEPRGCSGFGYDPVFFIPDLGVVFAELTEDQKNRISHRGKAMRHVRDFLLRIADESW